MSTDLLGILLAVSWCLYGTTGGNYQPDDIRNGHPPNTSLEVICALMKYYAAYSGNSLPTFRGKMSALEDGADRSS